MTPLVANIPPELAERPQWVVWRMPDKHPFCPRTLGSASSTDPGTWATLADAMAALAAHPGRFAGVGFAFSPDDPYCGIDLDDCLDGDGEPYPKARRIIDQISSYTEISPSGKGVKIICRATKPGLRCKVNGTWQPGVKGAVEVYDRGRYFTITGNVLADTVYSVEDRQERVNELYRRLFVTGTHRPEPSAALTDVVERCRKYLEKCPDAISGSGGHDKTLRAACECMRFGLSDADALEVMRWWSASKSGDEPWNEREIAHKIRDARAKVTAEGEIGVRLRDDREPALGRPTVTIAPPPADGASEGVLERVGQIRRGEYRNVPWTKWPTLTRLTQSLLPGAVTMLCGTPGVKKSFFLLDAMLGWVEAGEPFAAFELEEDRTFYLLRALALLERSERFIDHEWVSQNTEKVEEATRRHAKILDKLGASIVDSPRKRVHLTDLAAWFREVAQSVRVAIIDPVTAANGGKDRWLADGDFVESVKSTALETGTSLIVVTHPKIGKRVGPPTMDDLAGGGDYSRLTQTVLVLAKPQSNDPVTCKTVFGRRSGCQPNRIVHLRKTRLAGGEGLEIAFEFDWKHGGFAELGVVIEDGQ